ncbi:MAG: NAD-dependent epimerase/dehydratase family protein [Paracoccaceae bacterium]|nr:NAD-dependent epimerase/dehydratase family protein [Paracoccaceae bacterium]
MKIVILGCGGFVGSHLLDRLLKTDEHQIVGWDPDEKKISKHLKNSNFTLHKKYVDDPETQSDLRQAIAWSDVVINLAAICNPAEYNTNPISVIRSNLFDVYPIVQLCVEYKRWLISFSTSEVYGRTLSSYVDGAAYDNPDLYELNEDTTPLIMGPISNQRWTYACAKQMVERLVFAHHKEDGLPFTIVRPLNFFGPRMDYIPQRDGDGIPRVLACFMGALLHRQPMQLVDGGTARRTIVSIYEAVDAICRMLQRPERANGQIFNIGNRANEVTMAELAERMRKTYARITGDASFNDHPIVKVTSERFYGEGYEDCDRRMPDTTKARTLLGWEPNIPLDDVLFDTMTYFHAEYGETAEKEVEPIPGE